MKLDLTRLNQQQAAELSGVTARAFRDWVGCPRNPDGTYNGPQVVAWLIRRATGGGEFDDQRERLAAAQADKVEMENAVRRGELADTSEAQRAWSDMIAAARARLLAMPTKLAPQVHGIADISVIATAIRAEVHAALAELADYHPQVDAEQPATGAAPGVQDVGPTAEADSQRVGRRKKKAE